MKIDLPRFFGGYDRALEPPLPVGVIKDVTRKKGNRRHCHEKEVGA